MNISNVGFELIKSFEGCRLYAYKPVAWEKYWTIGWGHYGPDVYEGQTITQEYADSLLLTDLQRYVTAVRNAPLGFTPNQNQFDALVSFCYNLGAGIMEDFRGMTASQVSQEILLYNKAGGVILEGLVRRRRAEQELFNKIDNSVPKPSYGFDKDYEESGIFYPNELIYFRNNPWVSNDNPIVDTYTKGEKVVYDRVVWNDGYVWISWQGKTARRFMPIREIINGKPQAMWGYIE